MKKSTKSILVGLGACVEAVKWAGRKSPRRAWAMCKRGDWLLWIAAKLGVDRKPLVLAACACARTALRYVPVGEERPLRAIETAEAWARGEETIEEVRLTAAAAYAAADAAAYAAADAAAYAAYAAYAAADAAAYAAYAAYAADHAAAAAYAAADAAAYAAAYAAAAADAYAAAHKRMADLVRGIIPWGVIKARLAAIECEEERESGPANGPRENDQ